MMNEMNPAAKAKARRIVLAKTKRISDLGLSTKMPVEAKDEIIFNLATAKAMLTGKQIKDVIAGQVWYVNDLIEYSCLTPQERLDLEYNQAVVVECSDQEFLGLVESYM